MRPLQAPPTDAEALSTTPLPANAAVFPTGPRACARVSTLFDAFLDGALPELLRTGVAHHLDGCGACRVKADDYRALIRLAGSLPPIPPPPATAARLLDAMRAAAARPVTGELDDTWPEITVTESHAG